MTLEVKEHGGILSMPQCDTQNVIRQLLELGSMASSHKEVFTRRGRRKIKYKGHYILQFQNTSPDNGWTKINGALVTNAQLKIFLNFDRQSKRLAGGFNSVVHST